MQIFTLNDIEFPKLLSAWYDGKVIGSFWKNGRERVVRATERFVLVSSDNSIKKLAAKPTKSLRESIELAKQLLKREKKRGNKIESSKLIC